MRSRRRRRIPLCNEMVMLTQIIEILEGYEEGIDLKDARSTIQ